jgi:hypothetical protein
MPRWTELGVEIMAIACAVAAVPAAAHAQTMPPFDPAIDVQTFEYAVGPKTFLTVADGDVAPKDQVSMDALVTFLTKPFQIYNVDPTTHMITTPRTTVVNSMTAAQLTFAYGITDRLQLGANLPIVFAMSGDGLTPETGARSTNGLAVTGLGDLVAEAKYRLLRRGVWSASAIGGLSLPSSIGSGGAQFIGDDLPTARLKLAAQVTRGRLSFGGNAGVLLRKPRTIYDTTIGQQLTYGAAGAVRVTERVSVVAEGYGRTGLPGFSLDASPLEAELGLRIFATGSVTILIGGGAGLVKGIGSPESRLFVSIGYAPDTRDTDGDGIPNSRDKCPTVREDKDGFEDEDGCPDDDNDGDHRPDAVDKCPNEAEDLDGFEDEDGCPDPDNDKDGIPDLQDKCPNVPEDGKPPYPKDGCPFEAEPVEPPAAAAAEPPTPADDGPVCPPPDRDHDGVPDAQDQCPDQPETINGIADDDGCPDKGGVELVKLAGDKLTVARVPTLDADALSRGGEIIVDQMAQVMRGHAEVTRWLIAIGQPAVDDAKLLADAVSARLIVHGVPVAHVEFVTAAGPAKIGGLVRERGAPDPACAAHRAARPPGPAIPAPPKR